MNAIVISGFRGSGCSVPEPSAGPRRNALPSGVLVGSDSHTPVHGAPGVPRPDTTPRDVAPWLTAEIGEGTMNYKALEFTGPCVKPLGFWDR
ncbi:hypothetical protein [Streptomyces sp. PRh5]|uniref:hypothetical protein n=1 Tax=Streptomyces sp. PRh5 TaxID=1158056 RepID=UPI0004B2F3F4|nr:hypothetical protein [Streptomyces sp. PRh5]